MKTYNIDIVECDKLFYILDFSITRPVIGKEIDADRAITFARGYKTGIKIDSYYKFNPEIQKIESATDMNKYIKEKKKYYDNLWKKEV